MPRTNTTGRNTTAIESVAAVAANAIWLAPFDAASRGDSPAARRRSMFSSTMIASSITTPTASASASKVIVLIVNPKIHIAPNEATQRKRDRGRRPPGSAAPGAGTRARSSVARNAPNTSANWVSATDSRIADEKSITWSRCGKLMPSGRNLRSSSTWSWVRLAISTVFACDCFRMPMPAPGAPLKRARKRSSSAPSSTRATSPSRTGAPPTCGDDQAREILDGLELGLGLQRVLERVALEPARRARRCARAAARPRRPARRARARAAPRRRSRSGSRARACRRSRSPRPPRSSRGRASPCT